MWAIPAKTIIPLYIATGTDILFGWLLETNYWMFQNEADGTCATWWFDIETPWWTVSVCTILLQLVYSVYLAQKYDSLTNFKPYEICLPLITILPSLFCMTTIFISISAPVYYWFSKVIFAALGFCQVVYYYSISGLPLRKLTQEEINRLIPGKWFMRDLAVTFAVIYFTICILIDMVRLSEITVFSMSYLSAVVGDWCTSLVIVAALSSVFGILSNLLVAASRYLVTGQKDFATAVFDVNIGSRVNLAMTLFCLEAGILSVDDDTRIINFRSVMFLTFYVILAQVWDMTEQQCHIIANSGETGKWFAYIRVFLFLGIITSVPTIVTFQVASHLQLDIWMLLNASGNIVILCRGFCSVIEFVILTLAWYADNHLEKLEDLIYFVRLFKNLLTAVTSLMLGYHRLFAPFFSGWLVIRLFFIICEAIGIGKLMVYKEWLGFQNRRKFLKRINTVPDATEDQLRDLNDVCSICFAEMTEGKVLNCSHIFHNSCLRKWFQLRTTCPMCNATVF